MLNVWTQLNGFSLGAFEERVSLSVSLPVENTSGVSFKVISGKLPSGLNLTNYTIAGTPNEVSAPTDYKFVVRASKNNEISDRTFVITIAGEDSPMFLTEAGTLDIKTTIPSGVHPIGMFDEFKTQLYALDNSYVNYQLTAIDDDLATGQKLTYFIADGDGKMPDGLLISKTGLITGYINAVLSIKPKDGDGTYDDTYYDITNYDWSNPPKNGYDTFRYDTVFYDFQQPFVAPEKLNRLYEFYVSVTDGFNITKRKFSIFIVGDDYFRADNTNDDIGLFTADVTYLREPLWLTPSNLGVYRANNFITLMIETFNALDTGEIQYSIDDIANLPPGLEFNPRTGDIYGVVPYQQGNAKSYSWTITATRYGTNHDEISASRTFTVKIIGEIDSFVTWNTDSDLGTIIANRPSTVELLASTTVEGADVIYEILSGELPPGLVLTADGKIIGSVRQFANSMYPGLTTIDGRDWGLDKNVTTIDRTFTFTVNARDQYNYASTERTFTLRVLDVDAMPYSNVFMKPYLKIEKRHTWRTFIEDYNVFEQEYIYRDMDPSFGICRDSKVLVYAGIETSDAAEFITATQTINQTKSFKFGSVKKAVAIDPETQETVYEVVYVEVLDPLELHNRHITSNTTNSITNWRNAISTVGGTERNYLPLWMRSIQPGTLRELDFVLAMPICYCKPGTADKIILNIKHSDFDFKSLDFTVDRYIIDAVNSGNGDKYLIFSKDRTVIG